MNATPTQHHRSSRNMIIALAAATVAAIGSASSALADGACCLADGSCEQMSHLDCYFAGGSFAGEGSDCASVECIGACCLPDGSCAMMSEIDCDALSGTYRGNGIACASVVCELTGACCLGDAGCLPNTTLSECENTLDGSWMGYGSSCDGSAAASCRGACCFDDGTCTDFESVQNCATLGGNFLGMDSACNGESCGLDDPGAVNAIVHRKPFNFVMLNHVDRVFTFDKFDDMGGTRQLRGVTIDIDGHLLLVAVLHNNGDAPIDLRTAIGVSEDLSVRFSENVVGLPVELTSLWSPALPFSNRLLESENIWLMPGASTAFESPYMFAADTPGAGSDKFSVLSDSGRLDLSPFIAQEGDADFDVVMRADSSLDMLLQGQGVLAHSPHRALGTITVRYEYGLYTGACCLGDAGCIDGMTQLDCESEPGAQAWMAGMSCGDDARLCDVDGICCLDDETCVDEITEDDCLAMPTSVSWAAGGSCDDPLDRCDTRGACCLCDGQCFDNLTEAQCANRASSVGFYNFHPQMTCEELHDDGICAPLGACCIPGGPDGTCMMVTEQECADIEHSIWQPCITCAQADCEPIGACMVPFATCHVLPESECLVLGGNFMGANTDCEFVPGACEGDADDNGFVDLADLLIVIADWGNEGIVDGDVNGDQLVTLHDLLLVISNWGDDCTFTP